MFFLIFLINARFPFHFIFTRVINRQSRLAGVLKNFTVYKKLQNITTFEYYKFLSK